MFKENVLFGKFGTQIILGDGDVGMVVMSMYKHKIVKEGSENSVPVSEQDSIKNTLCLFETKEKNAGATFKKILEDTIPAEDRKVICLQFNTIGSINSFIDRLTEMKQDMQKHDSFTTSSSCMSQYLTEKIMKINKDKFSMETSGYLFDRFRVE